MIELSYFDECVKGMYSERDYDILVKGLSMPKYVIGGVYPHPKTGKPARYGGRTPGIGGKGGWPIWLPLDQKQIAKFDEKKKQSKRYEIVQARRAKKPEDVTSEDYSDEELKVCAKYTSVSGLAAALSGTDERLKLFAKNELKRPERQKAIEMMLRIEMADEEINNQIEKR